MSGVRSTSRRQNVAGVLALVFAASLFTIWWLEVHPATRPEWTAAATLPPSPPRIVVPSVSKQEFYRRELVPLLDKAKASNHASADKSLERLHQEFNRFRTGIPGFVDDIASWRTRFGIIRRLSRDKWKNFWKSTDDAASEEVKGYMLGKFEYHIMAQDELQRAIGSSLSEFKDDVAASRNRLLADMQVALTTGDMNLDFARPDFAAFQREFDQFIAGHVESQATDSLANATVNLVANGVAGFAAEQLVAQIVVRIAAAQAAAAGVEAAATSGSTAGSAAVGGAAGWLGGPLGAAIGVGAGLAVGAVVDWWMTDRFKANLSDELTNYLNNLERNIVEGVPATDEQPARIGLREALHGAADKFYAIQSRAALDAL
jgi:hypothetical protein